MALILTGGITSPTEYIFVDCDGMYIFVDYVMECLEIFSKVTW